MLLRDEYSAYLGEIIIEGYTDSTGDYYNNLKLSQERALSVATYILKRHIHCADTEQCNQQQNDAHNGKTLHETSS